MITPATAGFYKFAGRRHYSARNDYCAVHTVVEVREYGWGKRRGLAVYFFGNAKAYRPELFDGEWTPLDVTFEEVQP